MPDLRYLGGNLQEPKKKLRLCQKLKKKSADFAPTVESTETQSRRRTLRSYKKEENPNFLAFSGDTISNENPKKSDASEEKNSKNQD